MATPERFITMAQARRYGLSDDLLQSALKTGKIRSAMLNTINLLNERDVLNQLDRHQHPDYDHSLAGVRITVREAERKYLIANQTLSRWAQRGLIAVLAKEGKFTYLDEADVSFCVHIYKRNPGQGKWPFRQTKN